VLALYEDFAAGIRVREALEWLSSEVSSTVNLITKACSFSGLMRPDLRAATMHDAANADVVFVSASGDRELPPHVETWFDRCAAEGNVGAVVLVELHTEENRPPDFAPPLCLSLQRIARRWRTEFICDSDLEARLTTDFISELVGAEGRTWALAGS